MLPHQHQDLQVYLSTKDKKTTFNMFFDCLWGRYGCDRMVVGFTTTYAISAYHH